MPVPAWHHMESPTKKHPDESSDAGYPSSKAEHHAMKSHEIEEDKKKEIVSDVTLDDDLAEMKKLYDELEKFIDGKPTKEQKEFVSYKKEIENLCKQLEELC